MKHSSNKVEKYKIQFIGTRPLMFDQYLGNESKAEWHEKLYLDANNNVCFPGINLLGFLCSENSKNAVKMLHGKKAPPITQSLSVNVRIAEQFIPIVGAEGNILTTADLAMKTGDKGQITRHYAVARIKKDARTMVPNPKERPVIALPWMLEFNIEFLPDTHCKASTLEEILHFGGNRCGIGTFRPFFGTFDVEMIPLEVN